MIALPASPLKRAGLAFTFIWFMVGGIGHFVLPGFFVSICPPWVPEPLAVVYLSGVVEIALALQLAGIASLLIVARVVLAPLASRLVAAFPPSGGQPK